VLRTGIPPPRGTSEPRLRLVIEEGVLVASQNRHPSSHVEPDSCRECGFRPPQRNDTSAVLRRLTSQWRTEVRDRPRLFERAAFLRDEIHAVTNRIERLLAAPDSRLQPVTINVPTAIEAASSKAVVLDLLGISVERLARIVDSLRPGDWDTTGYVGNGTVTVAELVRLPLHHSYRDLLGNRHGRSEATVVPFRRHESTRSVHCTLEMP
jgi:hypothetical protein